MARIPTNLEALFDYTSYDPEEPYFGDEFFTSKVDSEKGHWSLPESIHDLSRGLGSDIHACKFEKDGCKDLIIYNHLFWPDGFGSSAGHRLDKTSRERTRYIDHPELIENLLKDGWKMVMFGWSMGPECNKLVTWLEDGKLKTELLGIPEKWES